MGKVLLVLLIGILGGVLLTSYFRIQVTPKSAIQLTETIVVSPTATKEESPSAAPSEVKTLTKGEIDIEIGFPSEGIPPLNVCLFAVPSQVGSYDKPIYCEKTAANQQEITITINPGSYHVFAWPAAKDSGSLAGSWTAAVSCGLSVGCTDHSPLTIVVKSDQIASGIEIKDWYGDGVGYPTKP